jgi:hypothetical protein
VRGCFCPRPLFNPPSLGEVLFRRASPHDHLV